MKDIVLQKPLIVEQETQSAEKKALNRWNYLLFVSIGGGILLGLSGLILGTISYLNVFKNAVRVNFIGNLMIIALFPLLMLGAHALDKISEIRKKEKENIIFIKK